MTKQRTYSTRHNTKALNYKLHWAGVLYADFAEMFSNYNPYHYCYNNPISFKDPTGFAPEKEASELQGKEKMDERLQKDEGFERLKSPCEFIANTLTYQDVLNDMLSSILSIWSDINNYSTICKRMEMEEKLAEKGGGGGGGGGGSSDVNGGPTESENGTWTWGAITFGSKQAADDFQELYETADDNTKAGYNSIINDNQDTYFVNYTDELKVDGQTYFNSKSIQIDISTSPGNNQVDGIICNLAHELEHATQYINLKSAFVFSSKGSTAINPYTALDLEIDAYSAQVNAWYRINKNRTDNKISDPYAFYENFPKKSREELKRILLPMINKPLETPIQKVKSMNLEQIKINPSVFKFRKDK